MWELLAQFVAMVFLVMIFISIRIDRDYPYLLHCYISIALFERSGLMKYFDDKDERKVEKCVRKFSIGYPTPYILGYK